MANFAKELLKVIDRLQNNVPALLSLIAIAALGVSALALFVVLASVRHA